MKKNISSFNTYDEDMKLGPQSDRCVRNEIMYRHESVE